MDTYSGHVTEKTGDTNKRRFNGQHQQEERQWTISKEKAIDTERQWTLIREESVDNINKKRFSGQHQPEDRQWTTSREKTVDTKKK